MFKRLLSVTRTAATRARAMRELDEELRFHVEMATQANVAAGMPHREAHRKALADLGGISQVRAAVRDTRGWPRLEDLAQDIRHAVRALWRRPGFAGVAVCVLAVGIGVNTAAFSFVNALLLRPLPAVRAPGELVYIYADTRQYGLTPLTYGDYRRLREDPGVFVGMAAVSRDRATVRLGRESAPINGESVSASYFDVLDVSPALGRRFDAADDNPGSAPVAVISHRFWRSRYDSDKDVLGKTLDLDMPWAAGTYGPSRAYTIVGVASPEFRGTASPWEQMDYWVPAVQRAIDRSVNMPGWTVDRLPAVVIGRLKPGVTRVRAREDAIRQQEELRRTLPESRKLDWRLAVLDDRNASLPFDLRGRVLPARLAAALLAMSAVVLLIASTNLAGLLMARAVSRRGETAIRLSLGAGRWRVIRQLLVESLLLSLAGAIGGMLGARFVVNGLVAQMPDRWQSSTVALDVPVDWRVLGFTAAMCVATGILVGAWPAVRAANTDVLGVLAGEAVASPRKARHHLRHWVLIPQVALSLVLLLVAGACVTTLLKAEWEDPGYDRDHVVLVDYQLPAPSRAIAQAMQAPGRRGADTPAFAAVRHAYGADRRLVQQAIIERVSAMAEVSAAGLTLAPFTGLPLPESASQVVALVDYPRGRHLTVARGLATRGYFAALGIRPLRGRLFDARDEKDGTRVAVVSDALARTMWPGRDPLGERFAQHEVDSPLPPAWLEVVGVVRDIRRPLSDGWSEPAYYVPLEQQGVTFGLTVVARGQGSPVRLIDVVKGAIAKADGRAVVTAARTMEESVAAVLYPRRMAAWMLGVSGLAGLVLACVGIYGVLSYSVAQRVRELGIRASLGATRTDIVRLLLAEGFRILGPGVALGLALAKGAIWLTTSLVVAIPAPDWPTFVTVPLVLAGVVIVACYLPARRASRADPVVSLRAL